MMLLTCWLEARPALVPVLLRCTNTSSVGRFGLQINREFGFN